MSFVVLVASAIIFVTCVLVFRPIRRWLDRHMPASGQNGTLVFEMLPVTYFAVLVVSLMMMIGEVIAALV